jgi:hypothetical protein
VVRVTLAVIRSVLLRKIRELVVGEGELVRLVVTVRRLPAEKGATVYLAPSLVLPLLVQVGVVVLHIPAVLVWGGLAEELMELALVLPLQQPLTPAEGLGELLTFRRLALVVQVL